MQSAKITAVANTAGKLLNADNTRVGCCVSNPFPTFIFLSKTNPPSGGADCVKVPAANALGNGEYLFEGEYTSVDDWWYLTSTSGDFGIRTW